jgi:BirA family biotin operon repressor/biotin-[acetyl-CoA-carboxylase] ligase
MSRPDIEGIRQPLTGRAASRLDKLEVFASIGSTNTYLMSQPPPTAGRFRVAVADQQTSGRGRHHRHWVSEPGAGLYMSLAYTFGHTMRDLAGLTLAIGVGVADALEQLGVPGVALKWPNDIVALDGKLGGILTEVRSGTSATLTVVTGIGLNLELPDRFDAGVTSGWAHRAVDLRSVVDEAPAREPIAAALIEHIYRAFARFEGSDFDGFLSEWRRRDWLRGRDITVDTPVRQVTGKAAGVGDDGGLLVDTPAGQVSVLSGSIVAAGPVEADG